jgi:hypothetical protein
MFGLAPGPVEGSPLLVKAKAWIWLAALLAFVWCLPNTVEIMGGHSPLAQPAVADAAGPRGWRRWEMSPRWACLAALLLAFSILGLSRAGEFLYYNF